MRPIWRIAIWRLVCASLLALAIACAGPPKRRIDKLYRGLSERLPRLEPSALVGRKILIDPGHGGFFRGTMGQDSLEEASVNLGVSLYLWGLLREAGARAFLTRSADRDFLSPGDSTLARDLERRSALVDSLEPDILVSIHHNAHSRRHPEENAVETYYRFGDPASRDLAFAVHRHLMRNLGIHKGEVRQGNYFILRAAKIPAILGEASYLTHPRVEKKLELSEKQKLEAEAYFLGILEYFHRGTPRLLAVSPVETTLCSIPTVRFAAEDISGQGIDPDAITMMVNSRRVEPAFSFERGIISYALPWDSPNGRYEVSLRVRNLLGNSSSLATSAFTISFPPETALFESTPKVQPKGGGTTRIRVRLLDGRGMAIADATPVRISVSCGAAPDEAEVKDGLIEFPLSTRPPCESPTVTLTCQEKTFIFKPEKSNGRIEVSLKRVSLVDRSEGRFIEGATFTLGDSLFQDGSPSGTYYLPLPSPGRHLTIRAYGYRPLTLSRLPGDSILMEPWFEGVLIGKRFILDPEGGDPARCGIGKLGLLSSHVNLQVARYLSVFLRLAGAIVLLTRQTEETPSPQNVVAAANRFGADRYIGLRHRGSPANSVSPGGASLRALFFPGSSLGRDLAEKVARAFSLSFGTVSAVAAETVTYVLQQTACPAIIVEAPSISDVEEELRLGEPWYLRRQAYAVFLGVLRHFCEEEGGEIVVRIEDPDGRANWLISLDDTWNLLSSPGGEARFGAVEGGTHTISARSKKKSFRKQIVLATGESETIRFSAAEGPER